MSDHNKVRVAMKVIIRLAEDLCDLGWMLVD